MGRILFYDYPRLVQRIMTLFLPFLKSRLLANLCFVVAFVKIGKVTFRRTDMVGIERC